MSQDPVVTLLVKSPLTPAQRRAASEAFTSSANEDELADKLQAMKLPRNISAQLWDIKASQPAQPSVQTQEPQDGPISRFASNLAEQVNPVSAVKGVWNALPIPQAMGGSGVIEGPLTAAKGIWDASNEQRHKAHDAMDRGDYGEMAARSVAAAIPILGPAAAEAGDQIASGDVAGGLGKAVGIVGPMVGLGMRKAPKNAAVAADAMEREAVQQVAQKVLAPKNAKYQPMAQDAAKELLKRGIQGDRTALQQWADDLVADADTRIDDVIQSYPQTATLKTAPVIAELDKAMDALGFDGPQGRQINPTYQELHSQLAQMKAFVSDRGADMSFDDMRRLRQQLDQVSKESGSFAKAKGDRSLSAAERATMDTANAIRRQIVAERPELAAPNADMSLGLAVKDILDPVKGRPAQPPSATTGATGGMHATGALIGASAAKMFDKVPVMQPLAAYIGSKVIPALREAQVSPENQLRLAQDKYKLAQALKAGQAGKAQGILRVIGSYVPALSGIGRITEPQGASQ
jgi:hypothetical protein